MSPVMKHRFPVIHRKTILRAEVWIIPGKYVNHDLQDVNVMKPVFIKLNNGKNGK